MIIENGGDSCKSMTPEEIDLYKNQYCNAY